MKRVMAFGDDWHDLELLRSCGFLIAMKSALSELKNCAFSITKTNDEDGVALVLEKLFM